MPMIRLLVLLSLLVAGAARADLSGRYKGIEQGGGLALELEIDGDAASGAITLGDGVRRPFTGEPVGRGVEAALQGEDGRSMFLQLAPQGAGLLARVAPFDADGRLSAEGARAYAFIPESMPIPDPPARYMDPPEGRPRVIDAEAFIASYPFWPPLAAARGYDAVAPRYRTVIRLFPAVQADLLQKMCQSPERTAGIAEALDGQGVTCQDVLNAAPEGGAAQARLRAAADAERPILMTALDCATDLTRTDSDCARAGRETAARAASMETVATMLRRHR